MSVEKEIWRCLGLNSHSNSVSPSKLSSAQSTQSLSQDNYPIDPNMPNLEKDTQDNGNDLDIIDEESDISKEINCKQSILTKLNASIQAKQQELLQNELKLKQQNELMKKLDLGISQRKQILLKEHEMRKKQILKKDEIQNEIDVAIKKLEKARLLSYQAATELHYLNCLVFENCV